MQTRSPRSRFEWDNAVYATFRQLPGGHKIAGHKVIVVLLRWAHYASWSNGRHGVDGYVSVARLAEEVGVNERSIRRALALGTAQGLLVKTSPAVGFGVCRPTSYAAAVPIDHAGPSQA